MERRIKKSTIHNPAALEKILNALVGISASVTWDPGSLATGAGETKSLTVTGAQLGDCVLVFPPVDLQDLQVCGYVQAANTVEIRLDNNAAGAARNLASATWKVRVIPQDVFAGLD